jgi:hypothetical protein
LVENLLGSGSGSGQILSGSATLWPRGRILIELDPQYRYWKFGFSFKLIIHIECEKKVVSKICTDKWFYLKTELCSKRGWSCMKSAQNN